MPLRLSRYSPASLQSAVVSSEREYESEPPRAGEGAAPPPVFLPRPGPAPSYEEYADPAAAHGWQNAYDETRELPPIADADAPGADGPGPGEGRAGRRRQERRRRAGRRRLAAVAGALGVACTVALIAGVAGGSDDPAASRSKGSGRAGAPQSAPADAVAPETPAPAAGSASGGVTVPTASAPTASTPAAPRTAPAGTTAPAATAPAPDGSSAAPPPAPTSEPPATAAPTWSASGRHHGHGRHFR